MEIGPNKIPHITDTHSLCSEIVPLPKKKTEEVAKSSGQIWVNRHGNPKLVSGDIDFINKSFKQCLSVFGIQFQA